MKVTKLIPTAACVICNKKFISTSRVAIISKSIIVHTDRCAMVYLIDQNNKLPEGERERIRMWDFDFRFTQDYEKSSKKITEEQYKEYKKMFVTVSLPANENTIKIIVRDRIWEGTARKYARQLQTIHALNRIWEKQQNSLISNFHKTFIPSVLNQFKKRGYLSNKQWELVEKIIQAKMDEADRSYYYMTIQKVEDISTLELPDRLRIQQRKKSFIKWFNEKKEIKEEE